MAEASGAAGSDDADDVQLGSSPEALIDRLRRQVDGLQRHATWMAERETALRSELDQQRARSDQAEHERDAALAQARSESERADAADAERRALLGSKTYRYTAPARRAYAFVRTHRPGA